MERLYSQRNASRAQQGLQFERSHRASITEYYKDIDYSTLPPQIEEAVKREDIPYMGRFMLAMSCYEEFIQSYEQKTPHSICMRDQFDLVAYMIRNSKLTVDRIDPPLMFALDYIDSHEKPLSDTSPSQLVCQSSTEKEKLYSDQLLIHTYLWEEHREILKGIRTFVVANEVRLTTKKPFITERNEYELVQVKDFFEELPAQDQLEIATGEWKEIDLSRRSTLYLLTIKLLYDITVDKELARKHPYLIARRGDIVEIVGLIMGEADGEEHHMRTLANVFAEVSGIGTGDLVTKCLLFMKAPQRGGNFFDD